MSNIEDAEKDYIAGMKYQEIADKYGVSLNTVKSWKKRHDWIRGSTKKDAPEGVHTKRKGAPAKSVHTKKGKVAPAQPEEIIGSELKDLHKEFCVYVVKTHNATKAYMKAYGCGYASAAVSASKLLKNPKIQEYIQELNTAKLAKELLNEDDIVQKYIDIAFADMNDFVEITDEYNAIAKKEIDGSIVQQVKNGKYGLEIKLNSRERALKFLADYFEKNKDSKLKEEYEEKMSGTIILKEILPDEDTGNEVIDYEESSPDGEVTS